MPLSADVSITSGNSCILFSRIKLDTAGEASIISQAGIKPPLMPGTSRWDTIPNNEPESWALIWFCCSAGKLSTIRWIVWLAELVCRVAKTRWPVSAAVMAVDIVSGSRISPTIITSGSWRKVERRALAKLKASW